MKLYINSNNGPNTKKIEIFLDKLSTVLEPKAIEIVKDVIRYWALYSLGIELQSPKEKFYYLNILSHMDIILSNEEKQYEDTQYLASKAEEEINRIISKYNSGEGWIGKYLYDKVHKYILPYINNLFSSKPVEIDISDINLTQEEAKKINSKANGILEVQQKRKLRNLLSKKPHKLVIKDFCALNQVKITDMPESIQNKINEYRTFLEQYIKYESINELFESKPPINTPKPEPNHKIAGKIVKAKSPAILLSILGISALIAFSILVALDLISYTNLIVVGIFLLSLILINLTFNSTPETSWQEFIKKINESSDQYKEWHQLINDESFKFSVIDDNKFKLLKQELRNNNLNPKLASKFLYRFKSSKKSNQEIENTALRNYQSIYEKIKKYSTTSQMEYIDNISITLGRNRYWSDSEIYQIISSLGFSPVCSIGQRLILLSKCHNFFILKGRQLNIMSSIWDDIREIRFLPEAKIVYDYLSAWENLNRSLHIPEILAETQEAQTPNDLKRLYDKISKIIGLHHNLSHDTLQKLEALITAYNGDIPENQDLFLTLIASGQQFKDKLHKDPDVEAVLNAKENKNIKSQKYIEKYLAPNEAIKYFLKCDENIAKAIIKNNKLLIWQKIEDIAAEIENSNQVELHQKNLAYLEYKQAIDESNDKNDIKQFIKRSYLEAIEQTSPIDNSLDYNEDSNKKMT